MADIKVTTDQLKEMVTGLFASVDTDSSGSLDQEGLRTFSLQLMAAFGMTEADWDEEMYKGWWERAEKNEAGRITFDSVFEAVVKKARAEGNLQE